MATISVNGSKGHHKFTATVTQSSQNIANNTSTVSYSLKISPVKSGYDWNWTSKYVKCSITVNGTTHTKNLYKYNGSSTVTLCSGSQTISHNDDGAKSISFSIKITDNIGASYTPGSASKSGSMTLTTIPRASTISSAANITLGQNCNIQWTPKYSTFKYKLKLAMDTWSYTTDFITPGSTSTYTYSAKNISVEEFLPLLPNSTTGTITATLTSYNSSGTQLGSTNSKTFTVTVPDEFLPGSDPPVEEIDLQPQAGLVEIIPTSIKLSDDSELKDTLVQNQNTLTLNFVNGEAEDMKWTPSSWSTIKSYSFNGPGISTTINVDQNANSDEPIVGTIASAQTSKISAIGQLTYNFTMSDTRDRLVSVTDSIECHPYFAPQFKNDLVAVRDKDDGTKIKCKYTISYANVDNKNAVTIQVSYTNQTTGITSTAKYNNQTGTDNLIVREDVIGDLKAEDVYTVTVNARDLIGNTVSSSTVTVFGELRIMNIHPSGTGVAFGKMSSGEELLESRYKLQAPGVMSSRNLDAGNNGEQVKLENIRTENDYLSCLEYCVINDNDVPNYTLNLHHNYIDDDVKGGRAAQLCINSETGALKSRIRKNKTWDTWHEALPRAEWYNKLPVVLYTSTSGSSGTITISNKSLSDYSYLEIFFLTTATAGDLGYNSVRIYNPSNVSKVDLNTIDASPDVENRFYIKHTHYVLTGVNNTIQLAPKISGLGTGTGFVTITGSAVTNSGFGSTNYIRIKHILGYK